MVRRSSAFGRYPAWQAGECLGESSVGLKEVGRWTRKFYGMCGPMNMDAMQPGKLDLLIGEDRLHDGLLGS